MTQCIPCRNKNARGNNMKLLVVVDMQIDFISGSLGSCDALKVVPNIAKLIREFDGIIAVTYDTHGEDYLSTQEGQILPVRHCIENSAGWQLHPEVAQALAECASKVAYTIKKPAFGSLELANQIAVLGKKHTIDEIVIAGLCTDICVISNALLIKAAVPEVKITVDASCCAGTSPENHNNALKAMHMCHICLQNHKL